VVELEPKITALGENLDESVRMQREHDETLRNLQVSASKSSKRNPFNTL